MENENQTTDQSPPQDQVIEAEMAPVNESLPVNPALASGGVDWQQEAIAAEQSSNVMNTAFSACLLTTTIIVVALYCHFFGIHFINGDTPDHWSWAGGLVGLFAIVIRIIVLLALAIPYVIMSVMGMIMSIRVVSKAQGGLKWFNGLLATGHGIMLIPAVYLFGMHLMHNATG